MTTSTDLIVTQSVNASPPATFDAFVGRIQEWWPAFYKLGPADRTQLIVDPDRGERFEVGADGTETPWGRLLTFAPPGSLALGWQITPQFGAEPDPERASRVEVTFEPDGEGCVVTLVHSGFERHGDGWEGMRQGVDGETGWPGILAAFANLVEASPAD